jgi:rubrerythrin
MTHWKCDKCEAEFELEEIPEECPECGATDGTFSLIED